MFALERRDAIVALVRAEGRAAVPDLAARFGVSEATVRRDLEVLERAARLRRAYGGALSADTLRSEIPIDVRTAEHAEQKSAIGRAAARMVSANDTVMLDASTTTLAMVEHLTGLPNIRAITSGMRTAQRLGEVLGSDVYLCGGQFRPATLSVTGYQAEEFVRSYFADLLFFSARALSPTDGVMDFSEADAHLKKVMLERSARAVLLIDSSKFGARAFSVVTGLAQVEVVITDQAPEGALATALEAAEVDIIVAVPDPIAVTDEPAADL